MEARADEDWETTGQNLVECDALAEIVHAAGRVGEGEGLRAPHQRDQHSWAERLESRRASQVPVPVAAEVVDANLGPPWSRSAASTQMEEQINWEDEAKTGRRKRETENGQRVPRNEAGY